LGQNVTWTNTDSIFHTVTSGTDPDDPQVAKEFDSRALSPGENLRMSSTMNHFQVQSYLTTVKYIRP
jgi:plastocyanin